MLSLYIIVVTVVSTIASPIVVILFLQWLRSHNVPSHIPWAGLKDKRYFPKVRAGLREITAGRAPLNEGYEKYGKHGQPFVLPALHWPELVIPPSNLPWLLSQPENVLSGSKVFNDLLALDYLGHGPDTAAMHDFSVLRRDLTRQLARLLPDTFDELKTAFNQELAVDMTEWKDIKMFSVITRVSRRTANRSFVGLPLCRDKHYLSVLESWEIAFAVCLAVIRYLIPHSLQPLLAPLAALPVYFLNWRITRMLLPSVKERIFASQTDNQNPNVDRQMDVLQWIIDESMQDKGSRRVSTRDIAGKAVLLNFFAVHTTALAASTALTDILCWTSASSLLDELREEAEKVMPKLDSEPRAVREMIKLDSVIRESMRLNAINARGLAREVVKPGGITTPDGLHLPHGTHVSVAISSRQRDVDLWEHGNEFVPLRFYRPLESGEKQYSAVHVTEDFLSFGLGRHACPGRFFAVQTLKLLFGHLLTHYDFEPMTERPKFIELGEAMVPAENATLRMRRRKDSDYPKGVGG